MTETPRDLLNVSDADLAATYPLIVPASYGQHGNFPAQLIPLKDPGLALTWVALAHPGSMLYVMSEIVATWEMHGVDLYDRAISNMREADEGLTWTHVKTDAWGRLIQVGMMHEDGLGSSRLLCRAELEETFPMGYEVALPDRSCGLALSASATAEERQAFVELVRNCWEHATIPMRGDVLSPDALVPRS